MKKSDKYKFFWSIKTSYGEDLAVLVIALVLGLGIHWGFMVGAVILHLLFIYPKEPGAWMKEE